VVALRDGGGLASEAVLRYLNRSSDLAFALARFADVANPELFGGRHGEAGGG
jgi:cob(I)alamin adenosyltransferase